MLGRRLSKQTWFITDKIREVDDYLRGAGERPRPREMHPEVCFWALNGGAPMAFSKKDGLGCAERLQVLERHWPGASALVKQARLAHPARRDLATDDIVDALAGAVSAAAPSHATLPPAPARDGKGLPMEMVYPTG